MVDQKDSTHFQDLVDQGKLKDRVKLEGTIEEINHKEAVIARHDEEQNLMTGFGRPTTDTTIEKADHEMKSGFTIMMRSQKQKRKVPDREPNLRN